MTLLLPAIFGLLLMAFEIATGFLLLHKGKSEKIGLIGTIIFLIGIAPLSIVQIPWLGLIIEQVHLLRKEFNSSFWEIPQARFRPQ